MFISLRIEQWFIFVIMLLFDKKVLTSVSKYPNGLNRRQCQSLEESKAEREL